MLVGDEHEEQGGDVDFIGDGVEEGAEGGDLVVFAGDVAIGEIGEGADDVE